LPPAAKNLFEKRFLDFQKLFIKKIPGGRYSMAIETRESCRVPVTLDFPVRLRQHTGTSMHLYFQNRRIKEVASQLPNRWLLPRSMPV
jgi:hypothetical protein